jgi:hypothetical protein
MREKYGRALPGIVGLLLGFVIAARKECGA